MCFSRFSTPTPAIAQRNADLLRITLKVLGNSEPQALQAAESLTGLEKWSFDGHKGANSSKKLLVTRASLLGARALLGVTRSY